MKNTSVSPVLLSAVLSGTMIPSIKATGGFTCVPAIVTAVV